MSNDLVVFARNAIEMRESQAQLAVWAGEKLDEARTELAEMKGNLESAIKNKWKKSGWQTAALRAERRVIYFEKIKAALEAGYVIVPDFPIEVFAVRTEREYPLRNYRETTGWHDPVNRQIESELLPSEVGEYVSNLPTVHTRPEDRVSNGKDFVKGNAFWAESHKDVDFPIKTVRPAILEETGRALALKVFDEMGICGGKKRSAGRLKGLRAPDPMVIGRIIYRKSTYDVKAVNFLIAWWLEAIDIAV